MMGSKDIDAADDASYHKTSSFQSSSVSCSICLDLVMENGDRSRAKLQCGHEFHLDCIGSAFNMKEAMQCPNCRGVEKGRWLYANGSVHSFPELSIDDWTHDEDPYELNYSEMPFRVHWCPFSGLTRIHSSFEEAESPSATYHGLHGHHAMFAYHTVGSLAHSYVAYFQPLQPTYPSSIENTDDLNSDQHWNEIYASHPSPAVDIHYCSWGHHRHPFSANGGHSNGADRTPAPPETLRSSGESDATARSGTFIPPFPYSRNSIQPQERMQVSNAIHHQLQPSHPTGMPSSIIPGFRRFNIPRGLPHSVPAISQYDHSGGFYIYPPSVSSGQNVQEGENTLLHHFHARERDGLSNFPGISVEREPIWGPFRHPSSASRYDNFWPRHWP